MAFDNPTPENRLPRVRLVLALHNHQPIGNFEGVFEDAYLDSYAPFLDVLQDYPELPVALHTSGSLLEWLVDKHPEYIDRLRELTDRGQIEIIGGPFYEPILACIPSRDRLGQIAAYSQYLEQLFGQTVRGMWVPERVWEQSFAAEIASAGIQYTILDDFHFRSSGLSEDELHGYFVTEADGRLLSIFPGSEQLRYTIPFQEPDRTIEYLRGIGDRFPGAVVTFGDDGEKFGTWPGTKDHVYKHGWLRRFFDALRANSEWLKVATLAEAVEQTSPVGKCYLSDCSYREMTEWALPVERLISYQHLVQRKQDDPDWPEIRQFIRGGFWRNFRVKYPEANEMYSRMMQVSHKLDALSATVTAAEQPDRVQQARMALYRGQCNCSYWHGAFGGLYLPHLRNAVYRELIQADNILEGLIGNNGRWVRIEADDFDFDARKEICLSSGRLAAFLAPARGGHLYELDIRSTCLNLLATLNRRPEAYHEKVRAAGEQQQHGNGDHVASIHDLVHFKQPDLDKKLGYDAWPRKSLVDHFLEPGLSLDRFQQGEGEIGDFLTGVYESVLRRSPDRVEAEMRRNGRAGAHRVSVMKSVSTEAAGGSVLEVRYELSDLPPGETIHFAVEWNFAAMAAGAPDRYYYNAEGQQIGQLESVQDLPAGDRIGLVDEWLGIDVSIETSQPAGFWALPIQTISQSEGGFELVHQSCAVVPHWEFQAPQDGRWSVTLRLAVDTSAAQARQLREAAVTG